MNSVIVVFLDSVEKVAPSLSLTLSRFLFCRCPGETHRADEETENQLHQSWFNLVLEKNRLARYESELMIL
jgi:hypothetical protein